MTPRIIIREDGKCAVKGCDNKIGYTQVIGNVPGMGDVQMYICDVHAEWVMRDVLDSISIDDEKG